MQIFNTVKSYIREYGVKETIWLILFLIIIIPYTLVSTVYATLGPSWELSISMAIKDQFIFGKDYIFTYGPLGILSSKHTVAISKWYILLFDFSILVSCLFALRYTLQQTQYRLYTYILIVPILFLLKAVYLIHLLTPLFLFFIFYFIRHQQKYALAIAAGISIISFYVKVNYGIILVSLMYIILILSVVKKIVSIKQALAFFLLHGLCLYLLTFPFRVSLLPYIESSLHLINAYNDAMYIWIDPFNLHFITASIIISLFISGFFISGKFYFKNPTSLILYLFCSFFLFLLFKNGFCRADEHMVEYFKMVPVAFGLMCCFEKDRVRKTWSILTGLTLVVSYFILMNSHRREGHPMPVSKYVENKGYIRDIVKDVSNRNFLQDNFRAPEKVSDEFVKIIQHGSVDIIPWEISEIYYHKLKYNPRPIVQSYSAYDEYLDTKNYEKYVSASAPDYLIYSCASIDNRHPFWDESITKRAMLTNYEPVSIDSTYLLMRKRTKPRTLKTLQKKKITLEIGKEYTLENSENIQYLYANVQYSVMGKLKRLLFQPPPLTLFLTYDDNRTIEHKPIVTILKTGVLINSQIETTAQAGAFFSGHVNKNPTLVSFRFEGPYGFKPSIEAVIEECILTTN